MTAKGIKILRRSQIIGSRLEIAASSRVEFGSGEAAPPSPAASPICSPGLAAPPRDQLELQLPCSAAQTSAGQADK